MGADVLSQPCCQLDWMELVTARSWLCSWLRSPCLDWGSSAQINKYVGSQRRLYLGSSCGAWTKAPEMFCSLYSLTFCLGKEGPVLQPCTQSRASYQPALPPNPISRLLNFLSSERRVLYTHRCASLGRPRERRYRRGTHLEGN